MITTRFTDFINHFFNKHIMKKVFLMLAVVAMASCSKSELSERPVVGDVEIKMGSTVLGLESRAPFDGVITSTNHLTAHVVASTEKGKYLDGDASFWGEGDIEFADETTQKGFSTPLYYPADAATEVHLFGYYPTTGWTIASDGLSATYAIDGKSDLMTAATATTKKADVQSLTPSYPKLTFEHRLTWLDIKVVADKIGEAADADQAAVKAWGEITGIELVKGQNNAQPANSCTVKFLDNSVAFSGTGVIPFYGIDGSGVYQEYKVGEEVESVAKNITLTTTETLAAYAIVAPIEFNTGDKLSLKVKSVELPDGKEFEVPLTMTDTGSTAGKKITITLTFKATAMEVVGKVTGWTDGGSGSADVD